MIHEISRMSQFSNVSVENNVAATAVIINGLKQSATNTQILLEDFRKAEGYKFLSKLLAFLEGNSKQLMVTVFSSHWELLKIKYVG